MFGGIEAKQDHTDHGHDKSRGEVTHPRKLPSAFGMDYDWRSGGRRGQRKADFTSGLARITRIQIPSGNPIQQQDEVQGSIERIVAVITIP